MIYSETELLTVLRLKANSLGRTPVGNDMVGTCSRITYIRRFGSWNGALQAAGFPVNQQGCVVSVIKKLSIGERMYLAACIDTDGHIGVERFEITVANNHKEFLENLQRMCNGAGKLLAKKKYEPWNINYHLRFRKFETLDILPQIIDYLIVKKERAEAILKGRK